MVSHYHTAYLKKSNARITNSAGPPCKQEAIASERSNGPKAGPDSLTITIDVIQSHLLTMWLNKPEINIRHGGLTAVVKTTGRHVSTLRRNVPLQSSALYEGNRIPPKRLYQGKHTVFFKEDIPLCCTQCQKRVKHCRQHNCYFIIN